MSVQKEDDENYYDEGDEYLYDLIEYRHILNYQCNEEPIAFSINEDKYFYNIDKPFFPISKHTCLIFGYLYNKTISNIIPEGIRKIIFANFQRNPDEFDSSVSKASEMGLLIDIPNQFNQPFIFENNPLPETIEEIYFGDSFNQPICSNCKNHQNCKRLNNKIRFLKFGYKFNQQVNCLPLNLIELKLHGDFNQLIDNLPITLKKLTIEGNFNLPIDNLPNGLEELNLKLNNFNYPIDFLPESLIELSLNSLNFDKPIDNLPQKIRHIALQCNYPISIDNFPDSIEKLFLENNYRKPIKKLPKNLKIFYIGKNHIEDFDSIIEKK